MRDRRARRAPGGGALLALCLWLAVPALAQVPPGDAPATIRQLQAVQGELRRQRRQSAALAGRLTTAQSMAQAAQSDSQATRAAILERVQALERLVWWAVGLGALGLALGLAALLRGRRPLADAAEDPFALRLRAAEARLRLLERPAVPREGGPPGEERE